MGLLLMLFALMFLALIVVVAVAGLRFTVLELMERASGPDQVSGPRYQVPPAGAGGETQVGGYSLLAGPEDAEPPLEISEATVVCVRELVAAGREPHAVQLVQAQTGVDALRAQQIVGWIVGR